MRAGGGGSGKSVWVWVMLSQVHAEYCQSLMPQIIEERSFYSSAGAVGRIAPASDAWGRLRFAAAPSPVAIAGFADVFRGQTML